MKVHGPLSTQPPIRAATRTAGLRIKNADFSRAYNGQFRNIRAAERGTVEMQMAVSLGPNFSAVRSVVASSAENRGVHRGCTTTKPSPALRFHRCRPRSRSLFFPPWIGENPIQGAGLCVRARACACVRVQVRRISGHLITPEERKSKPPRDPHHGGS